MDLTYFYTKSMVVKFDTKNVGHLTILATVPVIEYSIYNKRNYIYNDRLCGLMLDHMNTIIAMEESEERTALQREVREILCLLSK